MKAFRTQFLLRLVVTATFSPLLFSGTAQAQQGGYVLTESVSKDGVHPDCGIVLSTSDSVAKIRWTNVDTLKNRTNIYVSEHTWSLLPAVLKVGQEMETSLSSTGFLERAEFSYSASGTTWVYVNTSAGGPLFSDSAVAFNGDPVAPNFPNGKKFDKSIRWTVPDVEWITVTTSAGAPGPCGAVEFRQTYEKRNTLPANGAGSTPPANGAGSTPPIDISGTWGHGPAGETWVFTPRGNGSYTATETGFGNGKGIATVSGNKVHIDYTTQGGTKGSYDVTISADGKSGTGTWVEPSTGATGKRPFSKVTGSGATPPATGMALRSESRSVRSGETVTLPIWLDEAAGVANLNFNVNYDVRVVRAGKVAKGALLPGRTLYESNSGEAGIVRIGFADSSDLAGTGTVAQIPFQAVGKPGDKSSIQLTVTTVSSVAGSNPQVKTINGTITIVGDGGQIPGDGNGNGQLDAGDALEALKMSVRLIPVKMICDIDNDQQVTSTDARLILQKVVKK